MSGDEKMNRALLMGYWDRIESDVRKARDEIELDARSDKRKRSKKARERLDILPSCRDLQNFRYMLTEAISKP